MKTGICTFAFVLASLANAYGDTGSTMDTRSAAVDGYCVVTLLESDVWVKGESSIHSDFRGDRYQFLSEEEKVAFDKSPEAFAPMLNGNDPVIAIDLNKRTLGSRAFGLRYKSRTFFFADNENLKKFSESAERYIPKVDQLQAKDDQTRQLKMQRSTTLELLERKRGKTLTELSN